MAKQQRYKGLQNDYLASQRQNALRKKYKASENTTIKIENPLGSIVRIILQCTGQTVALLAHIVLVLLACIGLATLIYPALRVEFLQELNKSWNQLVAWL